MNYWEREINDGLVINCQHPRLTYILGVEVARGIAVDSLETEIKFEKWVMAM